MKKSIITVGSPYGSRLYDFKKIATDADILLWASQYSEQWNGKIARNIHPENTRSIVVCSETLFITEIDEPEEVKIFFGWNDELRTYFYKVEMSGETIYYEGFAHADRISNAFTLEIRIRKLEGCREFFFNQTELSNLIRANCFHENYSSERLWKDGR